MGTFSRLDKRLRKVQIEINSIREELDILRKCVKGETLSKNKFRAMPNHLLLKELEKRLKDFSYYDLTPQARQL